ncbi:hypothetical protein RugamoR57_49100 [Duganella caerulea]|uniref:MobH family relaxase n=1 Tax=Duganella caerulea TaxID=2885762 RepID=UPI0030E78CB1
MHFSFLRRVAKDGDQGQPMSAPGRTSAGMAAPPSDKEGAPFYPQSRADLLEAGEEIIRRIRLCYGREPQQFERDITAIVERYADFVNALPATASNYYSYSGGLFRLGLDTAFFALQATDAQIFEGRGSITRRRHLEPRWRHATFIAGLCTALQPALNAITVTAQNGDYWPSYLQPLSTWLQRRPGDQFHLIWRTPSTMDGLQNLYALPHIIPPSTMEYLAERNDVILPNMLATLARLPISTPPATMAALVRRAAALAIAKDLRRMASVQGYILQGDHLGRLLIDIMHDLVHTIASWIPNSEKSRVWHGQDGTFVIWPGGYQDIATHADHERLQGLPQEAESAASALEHAGMITRGPEGPLWSLQPPGTKAAVSGVKLAVPELVLGIQLATCTPLPPLCVLPHPTNKPEPRSAPATPPAPQGTTTAPSQLELRLTEQLPAQPCATPPDTPDVQSTIAPSLVNCVRLPADVADALRRAIAGLSEQPSAVCAQLLKEGVLVPLQVFTSAGLDTKMVVRRLRDVGMLVIGTSGSAIRTTKIDGVAVQGLLLKRQHVSGLPSADRPR